MWTKKQFKLFMEEVRTLASFATLVLFFFQLQYLTYQVELIRQENHESYIHHVR